ncbi:MAG: T9SS type A sorting domain-containing protein [Candidatus Cloacimonetes bacterium]|nr:T9SS type A sorting domain-containing protein [Candidatus Cloacimonadota bacterium]
MFKKTKLVLGMMLIMLLAMSASLMAQTSTPPSNYTTSTGLSGDPYFISSLDNLYWLSQTSGDWDMYYEQTIDIDASATSGWDSGAGFSPIGNPTTPFTGSYDGGGHTIDNLFIYRYSDDYIGLFGWTDGANIENLGVTKCDVTGRDYVGGLVGVNYDLATISNCYSTGEVNGDWNGDYVGGLVGDNNGTISNCYSTANVIGSEGGHIMGGLVGDNNGTISKCYSTGGVYVMGYQVGGLVGYNNKTISDCYSTGWVSGINFVGGLVGCHSSTTVSNSYSTGRVIGVNTIGGFIGLSYGTCTNSFWDKETSKRTIGIGGGIPVTQPIGKTTAEMKTGHFSGWDWTNTWERIGYNYPRLIDNPDPTLPVVLSTFTAQYLNNTPTLYWTTQSETDNMGWFVYRNQVEDFTSATKVSNIIEGHGTTTEQQYYIYEDMIADPQVGDIYYYWLESIDYSGQVNHYDKVAIFSISDHHDPNHGLVTVPQQFGLLQNEPNPVISSTMISFNLHETAQVDVSIYNMEGQLVKSLFSGVASSKTMEWNGKDEYGRELTPGVYFYNLIVNGKTEETKKLIIVR